jgi:hypothetical protein
MGPKTLPTIWYTYMMLVTKYQISAINSYWEKCDETFLGRTEGRTEVKQYTPLPLRGAGGIIKIYSEMHQESMKVTVMSRWLLYKGDRYDRFDCTYIIVLNIPHIFCTVQTKLRLEQFHGLISVLMHHYLKSEK